MIQGILDEFRLTTCAIGVLTVPAVEFVKDPSRPLFKVFGTGFLVSELTVLTNRHVAVSVSAYIEKESLPNDRRYVAFLRREGEGVAQTFWEIDKIGMITRPKPLDVALVSFRATDDDDLRAATPVRISTSFHTVVGDPVAIYGYAFGEKLLKREFGNIEHTYRFGPILQQGYVSAVAPYDHSDRVDRLLLDVRTSRGMSGSPVFSPSSGEVIGIHDAGMDSTVAFAIPLSKDFVTALLATHAVGTVGVQLDGEVPWVMRK